MPVSTLEKPQRMKETSVLSEIVITGSVHDRKSRAQKAKREIRATGYFWDVEIKDTSSTVFTQWGFVSCSVNTGYCTVCLATKDAMVHALDQPSRGASIPLEW